MPKKVSQLELKNRRELTNNYQVVVTDPTDYSLYRCSVPQFRGASVFVSENEPTTNPEDPTLTEYIAGDTYIQETSEGLKYFSWDNTNSVWKSETKLNGLRVLTATDFPDEILLDLQPGNFTTPKAFANDYYLNRTLNLLFSYSATQGFQFGTITFEGYQGFRAPTVFSLQGNDATGYTDPVTYVNQYYLGNIGTLTDAEKRALVLPIHQDGYHIQLENDEGHGGWIWYFDADAPLNANPNSWLSNLSDKLKASAIDLGTGEPLERYHFREAKTWDSFTGAPVQNDKKYRQGDNVFDLTAGVLYYNYQEGIDPATNPTLSELFEGQTVLKGSSLLTAQDTDGNWISPAADDAVYQNGDYILTKNLSTPRIHGPYKFGATSDKEAWPLYTVLRSPHNHVNLQTQALVTSFDASTYPEINGVMITEGDTWTQVWIDDLANITEDTKQVKLNTGATVDYTNNTVDWGVSKQNYRVPKFFKQNADTQPVKDDTIYYEDDYIIVPSGVVYGPYKEGQTTNQLAWPVFTSLKASKIVHAQDVAADYTPSTVNPSSEWGGATIVEGDTLQAYWANSPSGKRKEFLATTVDEADSNKITWTEINLPARNLQTTEKSWPVLNDADYKAGDFVENASGYKFGPYVESQTDDKLAWPFYSITRGVRQFVKADYDFSVDATTNLPSTAILTSDYFGSHTGFMLSQGDVFTFISSGGKVSNYRVVSVDISADTVTFSAAYSHASGVVHNSNELNTPVRDDNLYSAGDFIINANGVMYGPYVEGQGTDVEAWPLKTSLRDNIGIIGDTGSVDAGKNWKFVVENGIIKIEEFV